MTPTSSFPPAVIVDAVDTRDRERPGLFARLLGRIARFFRRARSRC